MVIRKTVVLFLFATVVLPGQAQHETEDKMCVKVGRVVLDIDDAKGLFYYRKPDAYSDLDSNGIASNSDPNRWTGAEVNAYTGFENLFQKALEKGLVQNNYHVNGWGPIHNELHEVKREELSFAFVVKSFVGNWQVLNGNTNIKTKVTAKVQILDLRNNRIVFNKHFTNIDFSTYPFVKATYFTHLELAMEKYVGGLLRDPDFKKMLEDRVLRDELTPDYETIVVSNTAPKAEKTAALKSTLDATVTVVTAKGIGSGAIISSDGLVLTCSHVVEGNEVVDVVFNNKLKLKAKVLRDLPEFDAALLKIDGITVNPISMGNSENADIGEEVWAVGTPISEELGQTVSKGILSAKRIFDDRSYLQTDASVSPGNSGGPLINVSGEILGIVNMKVVGGGAEGLSFAIPIEVVLDKLGIEVKPLE